MTTFCLPIVMLQLPSYNNYHFLQTLKRPITPCRPPIIVAYHLQCMQTFCGCYLPFTTPSNSFQLLLTICRTCKNFMDVTYRLQQCYFPCRPQISCLPFCWYLPMVAIVLWQKVFSIPPRLPQKVDSIFNFIEETQNKYINTTKLYVTLI